MSASSSLFPFSKKISFIRLRYFTLMLVTQLAIKARIAIYSVIRFAINIVRLGCAFDGRVSITMRYRARRIVVVLPRYRPLGLDRCSKHLFPLVNCT